jgi:hypothetical protein
MLQFYRPSREFVRVPELATSRSVLKIDSGRILSKPINMQGLSVIYPRSDSTASYTYRYTLNEELPSSFNPMEIASSTTKNIRWCSRCSTSRVSGKDFPQLDLCTLVDFQRINRQALELADFLPEYKPVITHACNALRGTLLRAISLTNNQEIRFVTIGQVPWLNRASQEMERGFHCLGCERSSCPPSSLQVPVHEGLLRKPLKNNSEV